jgi:hypothetical protein
MRRRTMSISATSLVLLTLVAFLWATRVEAGICVDVDPHVAVGDTSNALIAALEREATAIWAPYAVELRWQPHACAIEDASFDLLIERHIPSAPPRVSAPVLGSTQVRRPRIDRVPIHVDYEEMQKTLGSLTTAQFTPFLGSRVGPEEMGRALGRVVAHEIGHVLLGVSSHQRDGLMRQSFEAIELVGRARRRYGLSPEEIARLRRRSQIMRQLQTATSSLAAADVTQETSPDDRALSANQ